MPGYCLSMNSATNNTNAARIEANVKQVEARQRAAFIAKFLAANDAAVKAAK